VDDLKAGRDINVGGNLIINNNRGELVFKPLERCDHIELHQEKEDTVLLLKNENKSRIHFSIKVFIFAISFGLLAWGWSQVGFWQKELITSFLTIISGVGVFMTYKSLSQQNRSEQVLQERLNNINDLLLLRTPRKK
jgi:uncharacterized ion transporter superfamily protein YfcC